MIVLYGAGTTGRVIIRSLREKGESLPVLTDSDSAKWGTVHEGVTVLSPVECLEKYQDALWLASVVRPERKDIEQWIAEHGLRTEPVWGHLPKRHGLPPIGVWPILKGLAGDQATIDELVDQLAFRRKPDYAAQAKPSNIDDIYFPEFIKKLDDEHFCDLGACEGDTLVEFLRRWEKYAYITAFEPDWKNFMKLREAYSSERDKIRPLCSAVSDFSGTGQFYETGDMSAHLGEKGTSIVSILKLDDKTLWWYGCHPTFIKMDIEGSEPEALWGARNILKKHKPVLAICAYHEAEHLWELPLLIHAIQPEYQRFLRRYAEGTFELVWYAVPPERIIA